MLNACFHRLLFLMASFGFPAEGLPKRKRVPVSLLDGCMGAQPVPPVSDLAFPFSEVLSASIHHRRKSPPSLESTSKVFSQPPGIGTSHLNHPQESPSERGDRGHGPQHAGKPC